MLTIMPLTFLASQDMKIIISTGHINSSIWRRIVQFFSETINTWEIYKDS